MVWQEFTPKEWEEMDVDIKVTHCGICGSDIHTLRSGWVSFQLMKVHYFFPYDLKRYDLTRIGILRVQPCTRAALGMR